MGGFCDLPEELLMKIMLQLPIKSLVCVKCVQKSWNRLINSKAFVAEHLEQAITNTNSSLFIFNYIFNKLIERNQMVDEFVTICNSNHTEIQHMISFSIDFGPPEFPTNYSNAIHCNGLICLLDTHHRFVSFVNPALRRFKQLTAPCNPYSLGFGNYFTPIGFGHDSTNNLYKVVRLVISKFIIGAQIHILGIDDDDSWREIEVEIEILKNYEIYLLCWHDEQLYCKGVYYWILNAGAEFEMMILFDMHNEKFRTIRLPIQDYPPNTKLALWNESMVLFRYPAYWLEPFGPYEMWVMHESINGDDEKSYSWIKHLTITQFEFHYEPLVFWKNEELILKCYTRARANMDHLASYNLRTQQLRRLDWSRLQQIIVYAFGYVQSLVWID
ncbi:hypothetical protein UlMin_029599 [Ulmus minor]